MVSFDCQSTRFEVNTVTPNNATDKTVSWESSDASHATIDAAGKVTAVAAGTATITVTTKDGSKTATCVVWTTFLVFQSASTQWRTGMSGPTGLDYSVMPWLMKVHGVEDEAAALREIHKASG